MINRFFNTVLLDSEDELIKYNNILSVYSSNKSEEHQLVHTLVQEAKQYRDGHYNTLYTDIDAVIQGDILSQQVGDLFPIDVGNSEAMTIMNAKASIFDVNQINVDLKQVGINPNDNDGRNETFISIFNRILNENYLSKPQYKYTFSDAIKYSRGYPMSISLIGWDDNALLGSENNFSGDITCENIPLDSFYWDPSSNTIENSEYIYITKILPLRKIENFIKKLKVKNLDLLEAFYVNNNSEIINNGNSQIADNQILVNNGAIELITVYKKEYDSNGKVKIKLYHCVGQGAYVIGEQVYDIPYIPVSILKEHGAPNSFTGFSSVMLALPHIKQKYFIDGVCNNIALMQKNPVYLVASASGINGGELVDYGSGDASKAMTTNENVTSSVSMVQSPQIQTDMLTWRNQIEGDILKAINSTDLSNFGSKLSGSAVNNVLNQATIKENTSIVELERYLVRFIRIMLSFLKLKLPKIKQDYLSFRAKQIKDVSNPDDMFYQIIGLDPKEFEELEADIIIDASLLRTSRQQKQQQDLLQLYQLELQYNGKANFVTIKDIVETFNLPNKHEVIQRLTQQNNTNELQQATQLVQGVVQLMQNPEAQSMDINQATALVLNAMKQQGGK